MAPPVEVLPATGDVDLPTFDRSVVQGVTEAAATHAGAVAPDRAKRVIDELSEGHRRVPGEALQKLAQALRALDQTRQEVPNRDATETRLAKAVEDLEAALTQSGWEVPQPSTVRQREQADEGPEFFD